MSEEQKPQKNNEDRKRDIGKALLKGYCLPVRIESGQCLLYEITDQAAREVRIITSQSPLEQVVASGYDALQDSMKMYKVVGEATVPVKTLTMRQVKDVVERYVTEQQETRDIAQFAWKDDKRYTLKRITFDLADGPTPAWDQWCSRLTDAPAFKAWVWSIFEPKHVGRQGLWLRGEEGQDGKSSIMRVIQDVIGTQASAILDGREGDNRFTNSSLFDKRLLLYPDCKQPTFVKNQIFRNYTGGDSVSVEFKGMQSFSKKVYARVMIAANYSPVIDNEGADKSRLLIVGVSPTTAEQRKDITWVDQLKKEVPQFLHQCREAYMKLCPSHYQIESTNESLHDEMIYESTGISEGRWESVFEKWFEASPESVIPRHEVFDVARVERLSGPEMGAFKRYMKRLGIVEVRVRDSEGRRKMAYRGLVRKDAEYREEMKQAEQFVNSTQVRKAGRGNA